MMPAPRPGRPRGAMPTIMMPRPGRPRGSPLQYTGEGMLWNKQFYHYIVGQWLQGDPAQPTPPPERRYGRNSGWRHLYNERVMSMPDKWEYPWYASWDLAFHC